jgi:3-hydroxyanthranilate 3,4-dioxygenase
MADIPAPLHALNWIDANRETFRPPSGAKMVWRGDDMFALLLAGPNMRDDYHINSSSETFYQLKGDIVVGVIDEDGQRRDVTIREGEVWTCPAGLPHQPRRPAGTYGLVVERVLRGDELNRFAWYCTNCGALLHQVEYYGSDRPGGNLLDTITGQEEWRHCKRCGHHQTLAVTQ